MYIHLGRDYVLNDRDIIGIFNLETTTITPRGLLPCGTEPKK